MDISFRNFKIGPSHPLVLIAGPCQIESRHHALEMAAALKEITTKIGLSLIYKSSYDKANRTSVKSARGVGIAEGLDILSEIKTRYSLPVLTDIHLPDQAPKVAEVADILQIPAFLCRQTDLLIAAGKTGKNINVKKGQFLAPWEMKNIVEKIKSTGNNKILLCERGTSFGYGDLINDMRALPIMARTGCPIVFDATHSVQQPGLLNGRTGGQREFVPHLAKAAVAIGISALFIETHQDPDNAPSDGPTMLNLKTLPSFLTQLKKLDNFVKNNLVS